MFLLPWRPFTLIALFFLIAACRGSSPTPAAPIDTRVPWPNHEEATYLLVNNEGQEVAQGVFTIQREGDRFRLSQRFHSASASDEIVALVRADDLAPLEVHRVIRGERGELRFQVNYLGGIAEVVRTTAQDRRVDELNVPPNSYDNASSLFLWRTLAFAAGYKATYTNMMTAQLERSHIANATLHVTGKEKVKVPAGSFEVWRLEVLAGGQRQIAWYAAEEGHLLVMYDNGRQRFLLKTLERR